MRELDKILDSTEKVFWEGKPKFWPFFFGSLGFSLFGLIFLIAGGIVLYMGIKTGNKAFLLFPHFWIGLFAVIGSPIYRLLLYDRLYYAITNKRVIIQKGVIGRDFEILDFDQITNAEVNVGLIDKIFRNTSGSIRLATAGTLDYAYNRRNRYSPRPHTLSNVLNPYDVFKFFKKVSHDIKTDIQYPNKYRPKTNPGYKTEYK